MQQLKTKNKDALIKARGVIQIFYSTVSNTSKRLSYTLEQKLQKQNFLVTVTNIGDIDHEQFLQINGLVIFLISTYGNGGSPADGQEFMAWFKSFKSPNILNNMEFAMLGLGNRTFQKFCGNSVAFRQALIENGAKQLMQIVKCNSASSQQSAGTKYIQWSNNLLKTLTSRYELKQIKVGQLLQKYTITTSNNKININQQQNLINQYLNKIGKQYLSYYKSYKIDIIHIKQLRNKNDGRSTLWLRINKPKSFKIQPGCNINIYPQNVRNQQEKQLEGSLRIQSSKKTSKVPYPPMNLQNLWKIANFNQNASINLVKFALTMTKMEDNVKTKYMQYLKNSQQYEKNPVRCWQLEKVLNPGIDFIVKLGVNTVRPYTLASWDPGQSYIDLIVAIDPLGLTSKYLQSKPLYLRVLPSVSNFYVPSGRPIVMICNGTGIAPFRSITQYFVTSGNQIPQLRLYFGFQSRDVDYYFSDEWQRYQKQGKIVLRLAESRKNPNKKIYVQDLLKEDRNFITKHLFQNKGVIFICGSAQMGKSVQSEIFQAIKIFQKIPFKAFQLLTSLQKNKTIVKQIFN